VRPRVTEAAVIWLTALVTLFLFAYLLAALLRPERF
jgi:K+-transporting ATPase KdpF subunit